MSDSRRAIVTQPRAIVLLDTASGESVEILSDLPGIIGNNPSLTADDRFLYLTLENAEFDIWIADRIDGVD